MEYITQQNQFVGELNTVLDLNCTEDERLTWFIEKYEPQILRAIFGQEFYNSLQAELVAGLSGDWETLVNGGDFNINGVPHYFEGLKVITAGFIFYWYHRDNSYNVAAKFFKLDAGLQQLIAKTLIKAQQNSPAKNTP